jgi:hypothetical protein
MEQFTIEELEDLRLIYKTFCMDIYDGKKIVQRELTDLEKSIISKLETMIHSRST